MNKILSLIILTLSISADLSRYSDLIKIIFDGYYFENDGNQNENIQSFYIYGKNKKNPNFMPRLCKVTFLKLHRNDKIEMTITNSVSENFKVLIEDEYELFAH